MNFKAQIMYFKAEFQHNIHRMVRNLGFSGVLMKIPTVHYNHQPHNVSIIEVEEKDRTKFDIYTVLEKRPVS